MMNYNNEGLQKFSNNLKELTNKNQVSIDALFNDQFIQRHTSVDNIQELYSKSGFKCETEDDIKNIYEDEKWDEYITKVTKFDSWLDMQKNAMGEYVKKQLGF